MKLASCNLENRFLHNRAIRLSPAPFAAARAVEAGSDHAAISAGVDI